MEELTGPNVQVVLSVKEGKGFEQVSQATCIVATLNGHSLETELIEASANPLYSTNLVWEADKNTLRKMRSGHTPLKLECFALKNDGNKEKIGYLLLSIRSAQIISKDKNVNAKADWHKLLGLRNDIRPCKPEILLALSIEDHETVISNVPIEVKNSIDQSQIDLKYDSMRPFLLHDERLIQLGPLNCSDLFLLSIISNTAANLNTLLSEELIEDINENLNIWYQILENNIQVKSLRKDSENVWILNEKIVVRIRTSLNILKNYLKQRPYLTVFLKYKTTIIGQSQIDLRPLVPVENIQDFLLCTENSSMILNEKCVLNKINVTEAIELQSEKAYVDIHLKLQYVGEKTDLKIQEYETLICPENNSLSLTIDYPNKHNPEKIKYYEIDCHRNPGGDFGKSPNEMTCLPNCTKECRNGNKQTLSCEAFKNQSIKMAHSYSAEAVLPHCDDKCYTRSIEAYHCYCLNISLAAIKLSSSRLSIKNVEFRFHHPKAEIMSTLYPRIPISPGEKVKLQDIKCKLYFISSADEIKHLLLSFPPKISIHDAGGDSKICILQSVLDVKSLFHQNKTECQYEMPLYDIEQNKIGDLDVILNLENLGPYYRTKRRTSEENLGPPILDDSLAYKIVDELETWKERQKEIFKVELKKKEERYLNLLNDEWQRQKESLESKLACSVEQCKMLANSLNKATEDLRTRRLKSLEKEARLIKANEDLQWRYEVKLQELKDAFRLMQTDLRSKINILEERKAALEVQVEPLVTENEKLRSLINKQSEELEVYKSRSLTQDQTASLLQEVKILEEKLHNAQKSKSYFKEQWGKAVREIHKLKTEHQQALELQIKNSKEELTNLDLEEILCADSTALTNDKILLDQIQKEIDIIKPSPSFVQKENYDQIFAPTTGLECKNSHSTIKPTSAKLDKYNERLHALVEERDSLLRTGSYTNDDAVIVKLNTEIRSLLINS